MDWRAKSTRRPPPLAPALLTYLYQFTVAYAYSEAGKHLLLYISDVTYRLELAIGFEYRLVELFKLLDHMPAEKGPQPTLISLSPKPRFELKKKNLFP